VTFTASLTPQGGTAVRASSVRLVTTWQGVWFADVVLDSQSNPVTLADVPVGPVTITITPPGGTTATLQGTADPLASGRFVSTIRLRVVGGAGAWDSPVPSASWNSASGVSSATVEQATAALVGETVNDPQPASLGISWARIAGPASSIFEDRSWYVDVAGVTQVGTRPTATADPSLTLLEWDPLQQRGLFAVETLTLPGTTFTDPRFDGTITLRDTEQVWDSNGVRLTGWCSTSAVSRLATSFTNMIERFGNLAELRIYPYTIVSQVGALLNLQAIPNPDGSPAPQPNLLNVQVWPGMAGLSGIHTTASRVLVTFIAMPSGPRAPFVVAFDPSILPQQVTLDATTAVNIGPSSTVALAGGKNPVATVGSTGTVIFPPTPFPFTGFWNGLPIVGGFITITSPGLCVIKTGDPNTTAGPR
jgi:hypothetical protein